MAGLPLEADLGLTVPVLLFLMVIVVGIGQAAVMTFRTAMLLESTPNELRVRVFSLMMLDRGFSTVDSGVGGPLTLAHYTADSARLVLYWRVSSSRPCAK